MSKRTIINSTDSNESTKHEACVSVSRNIPSGTDDVILTMIPSVLPSPKDLAKFGIYPE
jgi:hypothetical protein